MLDFLIGIPGAILRFFDKLTGDYVLALFLFAIVVEILLLPFSIKQQKNSIRQARLRPKEMAIRNKYKGRNDQSTQQKVQNEIMEMYQRENFNPMQGCLPLLIQLPIIIALYNVVVNPLRYICQLSKQAVTELATFISENIASWGLNITEVTQRGDYSIEHVNVLRQYYEKYGNFDIFHSIEGFAERITSDADLPNFNFLGVIDLAQTPSFDSLSPIGPAAWLLLIPVLTFLLSFFSSKITRKLTYQPTTAENDKSAGCSNAMMDFMMPLMSVYIAFIVPGAIGVYWMFKNIITVGKQILIAKLMPIPVISEEEMRAAEAEVNLSNRQRKKQEKARSLHHIDDEDYADSVVSRMEDRYTDKPAAAETKEKTGPIAPAPLKEDDRAKDDKTKS